MDYSDLAIVNQKYVSRISTIEDRFLVTYVPTQDRHDIQQYKELVIDWLYKTEVDDDYSNIDVLEKFNSLFTYYYFYRINYSNKEELEFLGTAIQAYNHFRKYETDIDNSFLGYNYYNEKTYETFVSKVAYIKYENKKYFE